MGKGREQAVMKPGVGSGAGSREDMKDDHLEEKQTPPARPEVGKRAVRL